MMASASAGFAEPVFTQHNEGTEFPVDYSKYGEFKGIGTKDYQYVIQDYEGLAEASGDGIFPNNYTIYQDPNYKKLIQQRRLVGNRWSFINAQDVQACYFKWALLEDEEPGVKLFYTAYNLERAGLIRQAVKAYYACAVHFPRSVGWTYWKTPWYVGLKSIEVVEALLRKHPEIGYKLEGADIFIKNGFDSNAGNDVFFINPGKLVPIEKEDSEPVDLGEIVRTLGGKNGEIVQFENGFWQFRVDGDPMLIEAISYQPAPVNQSYDEGTMKDWMLYDSDGNGLPDSPLDSWVDKNGNNKQDEDEPRVGDFQLMKEMGANTIRIYHHATNKELLRKGYKEQGLLVLQGDLLGMYCVGSGASWEEGTDYTDEEQKKNMLESVKKMVEDFKDEPYVCMWVLGNENNYGGVFGHVGGVGNAAQVPKEYYAFVNRAAKLIKSIDTTRPVAICNGDFGFMDVFAEQCPDVDVFGINAYRGKHGFGRGIWNSARKLIDRPVLIMEYGCPAYHEGIPLEVGAREQAEYNEGCWEDIVHNSYRGHGAGTAIGGVLFQWVDGWWKSGQPPRFSPAIQETMGQWPGPFPDGWSHEEWFGVCGQGDGTKTPFMRVLRPTYFVYQKLWNE
jgi:beta-glucuronidase